MSHTLLICNARMNVCMHFCEDSKKLAATAWLPKSHRILCLFLNIFSHIIFLGTRRKHRNKTRFSMVIFLEMDSAVSIYVISVFEVFWNDARLKRLQLFQFSFLETAFCFGQSWHIRTVYRNFFRVVNFFFDHEIVAHFIMLMNWIASVILIEQSVMLKCVKHCPLTGFLFYCTKPLCFWICNYSHVRITGYWWVHFVFNYSDNLHFMSFG